MQGFKSFANKMVFEFPEGITGIVGPNGSGKSNVADAVRWVLGEQSAKQLRGGNMQDVIFAGTAARKPQSFASVAITFDNHDKALEIGFEEVTVMRRLYRSGESEYKINGQTVRLRDIHELFYDTGIGKEGYSIIGQGQIERIISGKADERRELFDEAAGIVKFKRRKATALKKLAEEQQNLLRVTDILTELTGQLEPLKKQSEVAKIYLDKREQLKGLDINLFLIDDENIGGQLAEIEEKAKITDGDIEETTKALDDTKAEYDRIENELSELDNEITELNNRASQNTLIQQQLKGQIDLLNEQIHAVNQNRSHYLARRETITEDSRKKQEELTVQREELRELRKNVQDSEEDERREEHKLSAIEMELADVNAQISKAQSDVIGMLNSRASVKGKMQRYDAMLEQIDIRKSELGNRMIRFAEEENDAQTRIQKADGTLKEIRDRIAKLREETAKKEGQVNALQDQIRELNETYEKNQTTYHRDSSRLESLKALSEHYEGYGNAIKKVMEQKRRNPGIHGVVADLVFAEQKYEVAIETALGGSLRNIVTDNESTAKYLIEYLKTNRYGRATFLPLTNVRAKRKFDRPEALREPGVIGLANELSTSEPRYDDLRAQLLGRTLVVDTIDSAIKIGRKFNHQLYMVTLAGESFSPGGSITGGAFKNKDNLLGRKREIDELEKSVRKLAKTMSKEQADIEEKRRERNALRDEIVSISNKLHGESIRENTAQMSRKQAEDQIRMTRLDRQTLDRESVEIETQISQIKKSSSSIEQELLESEKAEKLITEQSQEAEKRAEKLMTDRDAQTSVLESVRVKAAALLQNKGFISANIERLTGELKALREEDAEITVNLDAGTLEEKEKLERIETIKGTIQAAKEESIKDTARAEELAVKKKELNDSHKGFFVKRDELSTRLAELDKESFRLHTRKEKMEESMEASITHLWEEYELTPNQARKFRDPEMTDRAAIRREISKLKEAIKRLGNVNVNAIEDYKNVVERHTFLSAQHTDLVESEKQLEGIIDELDRGMRRQFNQKFAEIRDEFDRVFKALFGGGNATLEIDKEVDVLEAAISIIAEPPGKKLQNMMQLSGGEKSLTAISLLFAIQNLKPSPFCLLDEIEAALDDNNVTRFAEYLHRLTKSTQFIVITHRRGTMQSADRLYGITMQEKGVSALVSVNLIEDELTS